jgi:hypothetical protein
MPCKHRQQSRFSHTCASKQSQPLARAARSEEIDGPHTQVDTGTEPGALCCLGGAGAGVAPDETQRQHTLLIDGVAERVEHPPNPFVAYCKSACVEQVCGTHCRHATWTEAFHSGERHDAGNVWLKPNDFSHPDKPGTTMQVEPRSNDRVVRQAGNIDQHS